MPFVVLAFGVSNCYILNVVGSKIQKWSVSWVVQFFFQVLPEETILNSIYIYIWFSHVNTFNQVYQQHKFWIREHYIWKRASNGKHIVGDLRAIFLAHVQLELWCVANPVYTCRILHQARVKELWYNVAWFDYADHLGAYFSMVCLGYKFMAPLARTFCLVSVISWRIGRDYMVYKNDFFSKYNNDF